MKKISKSLILIIMLTFMALMCTGCTSTTTSSEADENKITLEKFNEIATGMTYEEVVEIIGEEGTLSSESSIGEGTEFESRTKIYYWYAKNGMSNAIITFTNNKVTAKSQFGL